MTRHAARLVLMMIRPPVAVVIFLFAAIGVAQAGRGDALHPLFTVVPLIVAGWFINATVLNDLGDEEIDRVNLQAARGRPLVSGDATRLELERLGVLAGAVAVVLAFAVNWRVGAVVAVGLVLNVMYSFRPFRLCDRGLVASLLLPLGYVALPYLVGILSVRPTLSADDLLLLGGLYVTFIGRILLKDFRDVHGDRLFGKRTFLLRYGRRWTCLVSAACWVTGSASLLLLFPWRSALIGTLAVLLACALDGLRRLAVSDQSVEQQVIIGAIAQTSRGMGITLLAVLTMATKGWAEGPQALVIVTLGLLYVGMYRTTLAERNRAVAVRPY